jgi:hypothetical protein
MDILAHSLWAVAAAKGKRELGGRQIPVWWTVWWAVFPDVLAFSPWVALALWGLLAGDGLRIRPAHLPVPLYPLGHSAVVFAAVFGLVWAVQRRLPVAMLGWLLHIVIDVFTHSDRFYATRFLWPLSGAHVNGIAWRTPWFFALTYAALAAVYFWLWCLGRLGRGTVTESSRTNGESRVPSTGN